jgi:hypothetical protein
MSEKKLLESWDKDKLIRVVAAIRKKQMGFTKAQHLFDVPMISLTRYVSMKDKPPVEAVAKLGRRAVFSRHGTGVHRIPTYIGTEQFWPHIRHGVRMMAFQNSQEENMKTSFSELKVSVCDNRLRYYNKQVRIQDTSD